MKLKETRGGGVVVVASKSRPDIKACSAVYHNTENIFRKGTKEPGFDNLISLEPFGGVRVWSFSILSVDAWNSDSSRRAWRLTGNITEQALTVEESFEPGFPEDAVTFV